MAPLGPVEEALLLELNLVGHALRVEEASVGLLSTATAPQLALDLTPNGHGPRLVYHLLGLSFVRFLPLGVRGYVVWYATKHAG